MDFDLLRLKFTFFYLFSVIMTILNVRFTIFYRNPLSFSLGFERSNLVLNVWTFGRSVGEGVV